MYRAFTISQQAGLDRLRERFPAHAARVTRWEARWDILRAALLLSHGFTQAGALAFAVAGILAPGPSAGAFLFFAAIVLVSTLVLDLLPRALSESFADRLSLPLLNAAAVLSFLLAPLAAPFAWTERRLGRFFLAQTAERDRPTAEDAIISLVDRDPGGDLEEAERKMIRGVFEMNDTVVREIMTPRVDIIAIGEGEPAQDCLRRAAEHK